MICTALLGLVPGNAGLLPPYALLIYGICIIAAFTLYYRLSGEKLPEKSEELCANALNNSGNRILFTVLFSFVIILSILYGISSQFVASYAYKGMPVAVARGFTAIGLIIAGCLADKNRKYSFYTAIIAVSFTYLLLLLYRSPETAFMASSFTYLMTGLFVLYPLVVFTDFAAYARPALVSGFGVLSLRLGVMISYLLTNWFILKNPVIDNILISVLFALLLLAAVYLYEHLYPKTEVVEKVIEIRTEEYISPLDIENAQVKYGLSAREKEVLSLILSGITAKEAAQKLYITERTVKAHLSSIYRKTGTKNRIELSMIISEKDIPAATLENKD
jgi:DNA-binding CsgD family transcriptional regulator